MRVLFDQGTPAPLRKWLTEHEVVTCHEAGWSTLTNGDLLRAAEDRGFDVLVTTDRNLRYQQNIQQRRIAIVVLSNNSWLRIESHTEQIANAVALSVPGTFTELDVR